MVYPLTHDDQGWENRQQHYDPSSPIATLPIEPDHCAEYGQHDTSSKENKIAGRSKSIQFDEEQPYQFEQNDYDCRGADSFRPVFSLIIEA